MRDIGCPSARGCLSPMNWEIASMGCSIVAVIGAGLWSASLGLAFNPIDHQLAIQYGSRQT